MNLHELPKATKKRKKRVGLGHGTGRGKTAGRGTKGQKARGTIPLHFEGGALPLIKRLPFMRGKSRNKSHNRKPVVINIQALSSFPKGTIVNTDFLVKKGLVEADMMKEQGVKILSMGDLSVALTIDGIPMSKSAAEKIKKAGGVIK